MQDWLPLSIAARAMGINEAHARRKCRDEWEPAGNARKDAATGSWTVAARVSPRLIRLAAESSGGAQRSESHPRPVLDLLRAAPAEKITTASRKAAAVRAFRAWRQRADTVVRRDLKAYLPRLAAEVGLEKISKSSIFVWDTACPSSGDHDGCTAALLDTRGRPRAGDTSTTIDPDAWDYFLRLYLTTQRLTLAKCYRMVASVAGDHDWSWPSITAVRARLDAEVTPSDLCLAREGLKVWRSKHETPIDQDPDAWQAGECWEADHSTMDLFARVWRSTATGARWEKVRPILTAWRDRRSRRYMGWHIAPEGSSGTIRAALLMALRDEAISPPAVVWLDNGKDFASAAIGGLTKRERRRGDDDHAKGILGRLGIEAHFALPFNSNGKARIERSFGFLHTDFEREFDSWCGSHPGDRDRDALKAATDDLMALPTLDEVRERVRGWMVWANARADHSIRDLDDQELGRRLSPEEYYQHHAIRRRMVDRDALRILEQVFDRPRTVDKRGIAVSIAGRVVRFGAGIRGMHPSLEPLVGSGEQVLVSYDPADTRQVTVWTTDHRLICIAEQNEVTGGIRAIGVADRRAAGAMQREQRRRAKQRIDIGVLTASDTELAARVARERDVEATRDRMRADGIGGGDQSAPLTLVRTPLDGTAAALERAELRQAVGAETRGGDDDVLSVLRLAGDEDDLGFAVDENDDLQAVLLDPKAGQIDDDEITDDDLWEALRIDGVARGESL